MNVILGVVIVIGSVALMVKKVDSKVILLIAGLLMALIGGSLQAGFDGFTDGLATTSILEPIITSTGFAAVMKITGCDKHLVYAMLKLLKTEKAKMVLLPITMVVTTIINLALNSATATAASMGAVMIPVMIASGYHPAAAAAAILISTYGSILNPGHSSNAVVAEISGTTTMDVVYNQIDVFVVTFLIQIVVLMILIKIRKEDRYVSENTEAVSTDEVDNFKVNALKAFCVFIPILLLMCGTMVPVLSELSVGHAMIIGCAIAALVTKTGPKQIMKEFWKGAGSGFTGTFSIVVCATVFVTGMTTIGLIDAMTNLFINSPSIAKISASVGPALMAIITGTGTGMAVAFNQAVSANAEAFGMLPINMGGLVTLGSCMARALSPVAGVVILTSGIAGCTPGEAIKKQIPSFVIAMIAGAAMFLLK